MLQSMLMIETSSQVFHVSVQMFFVISLITTLPTIVSYFRKNENELFVVETCLKIRDENFTLKVHGTGKVWRPNAEMTS